MGRAARKPSGSPKRATLNLSVAKLSAVSYEQSAISSQQSAVSSQAAEAES